MNRAHEKDKIERERKTAIGWAHQSLTSTTDTRISCLRYRRVTQKNVCTHRVMYM